eukprot:scaffold178837_cov31-Tisochrysis_lutea.AAC.1
MAGAQGLPIKFQEVRGSSVSARVRQWAELEYAHAARTRICIRLDVPLAHVGMLALTAILLASSRSSYSSPMWASTHSSYRLPH